MSEQVTITIDDKQFAVPQGETLLWAALDQGIYIPHLCALKEADRPDAGCRLCFVEIEGSPNPVTSCTQQVREGMVVKTRSPQVDRLVKTAFELLLSNHRLGCAKCEKNGTCELQIIARERGLKLKQKRFKSLLNKDTPIDDSPVSFSYDPTRCVLCGKCTWVDNYRVKIGAIGFVRRGMARKVATFGEGCLADSPCTECGECVKVCPVGALTFK